jgi:hypothetical protein
MNSFLLLMNLLKYTIRSMRKIVKNITEENKFIMNALKN